MAPTYLRTALLAALLAGASAATPAEGPAAPVAVPAAPSSHSVQLIDQSQPVHVDAANTEVDYKTQKMIYHDIVISQGTMRVQADTAQATGLNFANSTWTFSGNVRIDAEPRGKLRADTAVVEFKDNLIARATVVGKPAQFEQKREGSNQVARGHADKIIYDVASTTVRLSDDAWLSDGQNEISGPLLVYNIQAQRVLGSGGAHATIVPGDAPGGPAQPGPDGRIHITIAPKTTTGKDASKAPPATDAQPAASPPQ